MADAALSSRVHLEQTAPEDFTADALFDAVTAILVSQHLATDALAGAFFKQIAALLKPNGRLYSADIHIAVGQDRERMLALWAAQAVMSGIEPEIADDMLAMVRSAMKPRDESTIVGFIRDAGFVEILKPFSSLIYGAWTARKSA